MSRMFLDHLQKVLGVRGVKRVVMHEPLTNLRKVIFVQFARGTPQAEIWRGMQGPRPSRRSAASWSSPSPRISTRKMPMRSSGRWPIAPTSRMTCW